MTEDRKAHPLGWWVGLGFLIVGFGLVLMSVVGGKGPFFGALPAPQSPDVTPTSMPTLTPEPIVPTRTPTGAGSRITPAAVETETPTPTATSKAPAPSVEAEDASPTATRSATPSPAPTSTPGSLPPPSTDTPVAAPASGMVPSGEQYRLGVSLPYGATQSYGLSALRVGWVMDWSVRAQPILPPGVQYVQTVRMKGGVLGPEASTLTAVAAARPGSIWLISNEPDVRWQDDVEPQVYARLYRDAYRAIKRGDPNAVIAAGGIAQTSPLRLRYLDLALQSYQEQFGEPLPAQAWQIHNYMLREERDSWGVDIPPGISDDTGKLYAIEDSGNLDLFRQQIYAFRRWMQSRGYGGLPLIVSEFGIPMPPDYGFPPERVADFLRGTLQFFLTARDPALGDPNDGGRLVQRWCWFSLGVPSYPTGNLVDLDSGQWTPLGEAWIDGVGE